jgi:hypothetical protein
VLAFIKGLLRLLIRKRVVYRIVPSFAMTIPHWRSVPDLVKKAQLILAMDDVQIMLDVCRRNLIDNLQPVESPDQYNRAVGQALAQGYAAALNDLQSLAVYQETPEPLKETFEPEEVSEQPS